jgi:hypothetical protein
VSSVKEAIKHLKSMGDQHVAMILWCEEDVLERAKELCITITTDQAQEILSDMERHHDCEIGITWDTIDFWLKELVATGKATRKEPEEDEE